MRSEVILASLIMAVDTKLERQIVDFLAKDSTVDAMIDASKRGRPAVEAIDAELIRYFGDKVRPNPVKQHIGRLVRPVMENQGFVPAKRRRPTKSVLFTSGTVYGLSRPIMDILEAHGGRFRVDDVNREIRSAINIVGGNRAFARRHTLFTWTEYPNVATAQAAGALAVFGIAVDQALADVAKRRESALPGAQLSGSERALLRDHCPTAGLSSSSIDPGIRTAIKLAAICATGSLRRRSRRCYAAASPGSKGGYASVGYTALRSRVVPHIDCPCSNSTTVAA